MTNPNSSNKEKLLRLLWTAFFASILFYTQSSAESYRTGEGSVDVFASITQSASIGLDENYNTEKGLNSVVSTAMLEADMKTMKGPSVHSSGCGNRGLDI